MSAPEELLGTFAVGRIRCIWGQYDAHVQIVWRTGEVEVQRTRLAIFKRVIKRDIAEIRHQAAGHLEEVAWVDFPWQHPYYEQWLADAR